jgi:hypothetical protein
LPGCRKEYSYEGGDMAPVINDTVVNNTTQPYMCPGCVGADDYIDGKWSFYNGSNFFCGIVDTAIAAPARDGFTFFGPSTCSADSGLVMTINIEPTILNKDVFNSTTIKAGMYYYDNAAQTYPFMTQPGLYFSLTIESYIHQTRIMTGKFSGYVFRANGQQTNLSGKFKIKVL